MRRCQLAVLCVLALCGCGEGGKEKPKLLFSRPLPVAEVPRPETGPARHISAAAPGKAVESPAAPPTPAPAAAQPIYIVMPSPAAPGAAPAPQAPSVTNVPPLVVAQTPPPAIQTPVTAQAPAPSATAPTLPPQPVMVASTVVTPPAPTVETKVLPPIPAIAPVVTQPKPAESPKPLTTPAPAKALPLFNLPPTVADGVIRIDGSSTVFPIAQVVKREFMQRYPNVKIELGGDEPGTTPAGSGGGFKKFTQGETEISDSSRFIKSVEIEKAHTNKIEFLELPLAYDGISVVIHPQNDWVKHLTTAELKKLWEPESKIANWKDVRAGFPDVPIVFFGPGTESGTFDYFTEEIMGKVRAIRKDFNGFANPEQTVKGVRSNKGGLGYFGMAYFAEHKADLGLVAIDGGNGPVQPSVETVANGTYTPLSRPLFMYVSLAASKRPDVDAYVKFFINHVARIASQVGYVPLAPESYDLVRQRYEKRITTTLQNQGKGSVEQLLKGQ